MIVECTKFYDFLIYNFDIWDRRLAILKRKARKICHLLLSEVMDNQIASRVSKGTSIQTIFVFFLIFIFPV